ncbi:thioredoxin fold domain-containing protein [bacterium]|nr:thioredoxin fold domain-containing protein [bacterium]
MNWVRFDYAYDQIYSLKKPLFVYFYSTSCGWCRKMEKDTFSDTLLSAELQQKFIVSSVNLGSFQELTWQEQSITERDVASMFRIVGVPCVAFLDTMGQFIIKVPGYIPPNDFRILLKYVAGGWYQHLNFNEFLKTEQMLEADNKK